MGVVEVVGPAARLVATAVKDARSHGPPVKATCPCAAGYLERHQ